MPAPYDVLGEEAYPYKVVVLSSLADGNKGLLIQADVNAGTFAYLDPMTKETCKVEMPPRSFKIVRK